MKIALFAPLAAAALLTAASAFAAPVTYHDHDHPRYEQPRPGDRAYGYAKGHRVTPQERARWEAQQRR